MGGEVNAVNAAENFCMISDRNDHQFSTAGISLEVSTKTSEGCVVFALWGRRRIGATLTYKEMSSAFSKGWVEAGQLSNIIKTKGGSRKDAAELEAAKQFCLGDTIKEYSDFKGNFFDIATIENEAEIKSGQCTLKKCRDSQRSKAKTRNGTGCIQVTLTFEQMKPAFYSSESGDLLELYKIMEAAH